jgi:hypothetical protein
MKKYKFELTLDQLEILDDVLWNIEESRVYFDEDKEILEELKKILTAENIET